MKHYNRFIKEINSLVVTTKERFVTQDGRILYAEDQQYDPAHSLPENDTKLFPNFRRETFLNLDRYHYKNTTDRYADTLKQLREKAKTDIILLGNEQGKGILTDAIDHRDRLIRLHDKATEYVKMMREGTPDDSFLELQLLDCFTSNRPKGSSDRYFANCLRIAIMEKQGALTALIKQLQNILPTITPAESDSPNPDRSNTKKEPSDNAQ
jgi:hypothetical protein